MSSHKVQPNRTYDYIYDTTFTASSVKDHVAQIQRTKTFDKAIAPIVENLFSDLQHFPRSEKVNKPKTIHASASLGNDRTTYYPPADVSGADRFKYFRRPILPYLSNLGGQIVYARKKNARISSDQQTANQAGRPVTPFSKSVGIQTLYRESEAQTEPYSPEYVLKVGARETPPEILALATLTYGHGLPAGIVELEMIERSRIKRAWEASLPKVVDEETFKTRIKMMEQMELYEWKERENEIQRLQDIRLSILTRVIEDREKENHQHHTSRIERIWQCKLQERDAMLDKIEQKRQKALRKVAEKRAKVEPGKERRDIISEYTNFGSRVYAPKARDGVFMDNVSMTLKLEPEQDLETFEGVTRLEHSLPPAVLKMPFEQPPLPNSGRTANDRREVHIKQQLDLMDLFLSNQKQRAETPKALRYLERIQILIDRPKTPAIEVPRADQDDLEASALLLQKLIRGRIAQNLMYRGKERRLDLIQELKMRNMLQKAKAEQAQTPDTRQGLAGENIERGDEDFLEDAYNENDRQNEGVTENQDQAISNASPVESTLSMARAKIYMDPVELENLFEAKVQAEYVGHTIDFITKQIVRLREERRVLAMVKLAERIRRIREAEESGRRQQEIKRQRLHDEIFRQTMHVHQDTVDSYLEDILMETAETTAGQQSRTEVREYIAKLNAVLTEVNAGVEEEDERVVLDLVHSFLLPEVEKETVRRASKDKETTLLIAAHQALHGELNRVIDEKVSEMSSSSSNTNPPSS